MLDSMAAGWTCRDYPSVTERFHEKLFYSDPLNYAIFSNPCSSFSPTMAANRRDVFFTTRFSMKTDRWVPRNILTRARTVITVPFG